MSTIQLSVSDALARRIGKEELQRLLQEHLERLEEETLLKPLHATQIPLEEEPFIGMWADREDMKDSVEYVRNLRRNFNRVSRWEKREQDQNPL